MELYNLSEQLVHHGSGCSRETFSDYCNVEIVDHRLCGLAVSFNELALHIMSSI